MESISFLLVVDGWETSVDVWLGRSPLSVSTISSMGGLFLRSISTHLAPISMHALTCWRLSVSSDAYLDVMYCSVQSLRTLSTKFLADGWSSSRGFCSLVVISIINRPKLYISSGGARSRGVRSAVRAPHPGEHRVRLRRRDDPGSEAAVERPPAGRSDVRAVGDAGDRDRAVLLLGRRQLRQPRQDGDQRALPLRDRRREPSPSDPRRRVRGRRTASRKRASVAGLELVGPGLARR